MIQAAHTPGRDRSRSTPKAATGALRQALAWTPLVLPLLVALQITFAGLRPALLESRRLEREGARMELEYEQLLSERQQLEAHYRAQRDPLYIERERRLKRLQVR